MLFSAPLAKALQNTFPLGESLFAMRWTLVLFPLLAPKLGFDTRVHTRFAVHIVELAGGSEVCLTFRLYSKLCAGDLLWQLLVLAYAHIQ